MEKKLTLKDLENKKEEVTVEEASSSTNTTLNEVSPTELFPPEKQESILDVIQKPGLDKCDKAFERWSNKIDKRREEVNDAYEEYKEEQEKEEEAETPNNIFEKENDEDTEAAAEETPVSIADIPSNKKVIIKNTDNGGQKMNNENKDEEIKEIPTETHAEPVEAPAPDKVDTEKSDEFNKLILFKDREKIEQPSLADRPSDVAAVAFPDDDDEEDSTEEKDSKLDEIKLDIKKKIKPITTTFDISSFQISNKPVSVSSAMKDIPENPTIRWGLFATGYPVVMEKLNGMDIEALDPRFYPSASRIDAYKSIYKTLFSHIKNNPIKDFEQWLKRVIFFDINHLFFAAYIACYEGSNYIPYQCPKCGKVFMKEVEIKDMVKYKSDAAKKAVMEVLHMNDQMPEAYPVEVVQISDSIAIGFREPSIYNVVFENAILDEKFTAKYSQILSFMSYIDTIYSIDAVNKQLNPVDYKVYPNNDKKTVAERVKTYSKILKSFNSDQLNLFNMIMQQIDDKHDKVQYITPAVTCDHCGAEIPEDANQSAQDLLFMRHRLMGLAASSTK